MTAKAQKTASSTSIFYDTGIPLSTRYRVHYFQGHSGPVVSKCITKIANKSHNEPLPEESTSPMIDATAFAPETAAPVVFPAHPVRRLHPAAHLLCAIAAGQPLEYKCPFSGEWMPDPDALEAIATTTTGDYSRWRVAQAKA